LAVIPNCESSWEIRRSTALTLSRLRVIEKADADGVIQTTTGSFDSSRGGVMIDDDDERFRTDAFCEARVIDRRALSQSQIVAVLIHD
jgi:hypothetical protein